MLQMFAVKFLKSIVKFLEKIPKMILTNFAKVVIYLELPESLAKDASIIFFVYMKNT